MVLCGIFLFRILRPKDGIFTPHLKEHVGGWADRLRYLGTVDWPLALYARCSEHDGLPLHRATTGHAPSYEHHHVGGNGLVTQPFAPMVHVESSDHHHFASPSSPE